MMSTTKYDLTPKETLFIATECHLASLQDGDGDTPLHISIVKCESEKSKELIKLFTISRKNIDILNRLMQTPLHLSVITSQTEILEDLLHCGANPNVLDRFGCNVSHIAAKYNAIACLQASFKHSKFPLNFEKINLEGLTALHIAVRNNSIDVLQELLHYGANIDVKDNKSGRSPLIYAIETDNFAIVEILLEKGASVCEQTYSGDTALHIASGRGIQSIIRLLLRKGADLSNRNLPNEDLTFFNNDFQMLQMLQAGVSGITHGDKNINSQLIRSMSCPSTPLEPKALLCKQTVGKHRLENDKREKSESIKRKKLGLEIANLKQEPVSTQSSGSSGSTIYTDKNENEGEGSMDKRCIYPCIKPFGYSSYSTVLPPPPPIMASSYLPPQLFKEELYRKCVENTNTVKTSVPPFYIIPKKEKDTCTLPDTSASSLQEMFIESDAEKPNAALFSSDRNERASVPPSASLQFISLPQFKRQTERSMSVPGSPNPSDEALFQVAREGLAVAAMPSVLTTKPGELITQSSTAPSRIRPARQAQIKSKTNELQKLALQGLAVAAMKELKQESIEKSSRGVEEMYKPPVEQFVSDELKKARLFSVSPSFHYSPRRSPIEPSLLALAQASVGQPGVAQAISAFNCNEVATDDTAIKRDDYQISVETKQSLREAILEKKKTTEPKVSVLYTSAQTNTNQKPINVEIVRPTTTIDVPIKIENIEDAKITQNETKNFTADTTLQRIRQRLIELNWKIQNLLSPPSDCSPSGETLQLMSTYSAEYALLCQKAEDLGKDSINLTKPVVKSQVEQQDLPTQTRLNPVYPVKMTSLHPVHHTLFSSSPQLVMHPSLTSPQLSLSMRYPYMTGASYQALTAKQYPMYYLDYRHALPGVANSTSSWQSSISPNCQKQSELPLNNTKIKEQTPTESKLVAPVHPVPHLTEDSYAMDSTNNTTMCQSNKKPMAAVVAISKQSKHETAEDQPLNLSKKEAQPLNLQTIPWNPRSNTSMSSSSVCRKKTSQVLKR